jgi:hypothetical protein
MAPLQLTRVVDEAMIGIGGHRPLDSIFDPQLQVAQERSDSSDEKYESSSLAIRIEIISRCWALVREVSLLDGLDKDILFSLNRLLYHFCKIEKEIDYILGIL